MVAGSNPVSPTNVMLQDIGIGLNLHQVQTFFRVGPLGAPVGW